MFYRQKFVTNSSSTSFIFFGINFDEDSANNILEKIIPPEELTKATWEDQSQILWDWAETLKGDIGLYIDPDCQSGMAYINNSYWSLEGSVDDLPIDHLQESKAKEEEWMHKIKLFCLEYGITATAYGDSTAEPAWRVAIDVRT